MIPMASSSGRVNRQQPQQLSSDDTPYTIYTIARLEACSGWQGHEVVYYRGNFDKDIAACAPVRPRQETPHAAVLRSVRDVAEALAAAGKLRLEKRHLMLPHRNGDIHITKYVAIGI